MMKNTAIKFLTLGLLALGIGACGGGGGETPLISGGGGTPSITFGQGTGFSGAVVTTVPATDASGDIYVGGGYSLYNGTGSNNIIRLNSNGTIDSGFAIGIGFNGPVSTLATATDGSGDIYVGGGFGGFAGFSSYNGTGANRIIRLNSDGTVDRGFTIGIGFSRDVKTLALATDGSGDIYVGGFFTSYNGTGANRIIRLNSNGTVDPIFNIGAGFDGFSVDTLALATDGSGDIYVGGSFTAYKGIEVGGIIRLNSDGTVDPLFNREFNNGGVFSLMPATDGSGDIYVGGFFGAENIIRLKSNGIVDSLFNIGTGFNTLSVETLLPTTDGSGDIYVGGTFTSYNGTGANRIIRLNSDGTVDQGFAIGTGFTSTAFGIDLASVKTLLPATDGSGDIYVGGAFTTYNGIRVGNIVRLSSAGAVR